MQKFHLAFILALTSCLLQVHSGIAQKGKKSSPPIKDKNLEAAIKKMLQHTKGELNDKALANVYVLLADGKKIKDLSGLEKCKNIQQLKLTNNDISNIEPIKDLKNLISLDLAKNKIKDIKPLAGLTALQFIELSDNDVADVAPLGKLKNLAALYLSGNEIKDISPLENLKKLYSLSLNRNKIENIDVLNKLTGISTLDLEGNQINDLSPLAKQRELNLLLLRKNKIKDLTPLLEAVKADAKGERRFAPFLRLYIRDGNPLSDQGKAQLKTLAKFGVRVKG